MAGTPLGRVVQKSVAKEVGDRYRNAREMLQALENALTARTEPISVPNLVLGRTGRPSDQPPVARPGGPQSEGGIPIAVAAAVVALVIVVLAGLWFVLRDDGAVAGNEADADSEVASDAVDGLGEDADTVQAEVEVDEPELLDPPTPPWSGSVAETLQIPTQSELGEFPGPLLELDEAGLYTRRALELLELGALAIEDQEELRAATTDAQIHTFNLTRIYLALGYCEAGQTLLDAGRQSWWHAEVTAEHAERSALESEVSACLALRDNLSWNGGDYQTAVTVARTEYAASREARPSGTHTPHLWLVLLNGRLAVDLAQDALLRGVLDPPDQERLIGELQNLHNLVVAALFELDLEINAELYLSALLGGSSRLGEDALAEFEELLTRVAQDNRSPHEAWQWQVYRSETRRAAAAAGRIQGQEAP